MWCRILMLASAVFYYGFGQTGNTSPATLFDAYDLLQSTLGQGESPVTSAPSARQADLTPPTAAATLFALALLAFQLRGPLVALAWLQVVSTVTRGHGPKGLPACPGGEADAVSLPHVPKFSPANGKPA